jgi:hypothetical protein
MAQSSARNCRGNALTAPAGPGRRARQSENSEYREAKVMTEKSLPQPAPPQGKSRFFTTGVLLWSSLAAASLVYLLLLATQPDMVARYLGAGASGASAETDAATHAAKQAVADVHTLRDTVDLFRNELIEIRAQVSSQTDSNRELLSRIAALETSPPDTQHAAKDAKETVKVQNTKASAKIAPPAKTAAAKVKKEQEHAAAAHEPGLETGSVAQPGAAAIAFGTPTVTSTALPSGNGKMIGVQIATGPSVDSLRLNWALLTDRHGEALRAYQPRYVAGPPGAEPSYDLVVGPLASVQDATRLCQELAMKATPCSVSRYTGDAL